MINVLKKEPALVTALVQEILIVAVAFGLELTPEQIAAVIGVSTALLALITRALSSPVKAG